MDAHHFREKAPRILARVAVAVIDAFLSQPSLMSEEQDYLKVLGDLVEAYGTESHPMGTVSDADLLSHLIEARGVSQREVAGATGIAVSIISEVLRESLLREDHAVLRRAADSIHWKSRYVEQAENLARFVDVTFNLLPDLPGGVCGVTGGGKSGLGSGVRRLRGSCLRQPLLGH